MIDQLKNVSVREWIRALQRDGFVLRKGKGSHHRFRHPDGRITLLVYHNLGDTLRPRGIKDLLTETRWTEDDLKRLRLLP